MPNDTRKTAWSKSGDGLGPARVIGTPHYSPNPDVSTGLAVAMNSVNTSCTATSAASGFADSGYFLIDNEIIGYSSKGTDVFNGIAVATFIGFTRGVNGTIPVAHAANAPMFSVAAVYAKDRDVQSGCRFCGSLKWQDSKPVALPDDRFLPSDENRRRKNKGR